MRVWIYYFGVVCILFSCSSNEERTDKIDLSKDENVIAALNKSSKHKLSKNDVCIERPGSFKELVLVGYFAHDRGCMGNVVFYKGVESTVSEIYQQLLLDHGWKENEKREVLALNLVTQVLLKWVSPLFSEPKNFNTNSMHAFMPPTTRNENGEIIVSTWVLETPGRQPESSYYLFTAAFDANGKMSRSEMTDRFSVNY